MSVLSRLLCAFGLKKPESPEPIVQEPTPVPPSPSRYCVEQEEAPTTPSSSTFSYGGVENKTRAIPVLTPDSDGVDDYRTVARIMFEFVELTEQERAEVEKRINTDDFSSSDRFNQIFFALNLQGRFKWSEWDYWLEKLGEDTIASDSLFASRFLDGIEVDTWGFEPVPTFTRQTLEDRTISIANFDAACVACGVAPSGKKRWNTVLAYFDGLPPETQAAILSECQRAEQLRRDKWKVGKTPKKGDYWLFSAFTLALRARANERKTFRLGFKAKKFEYSNHTRKEAIAWQADKNCPWQEPYGGKNPFSLFFTKVDLGV